MSMPNAKGVLLEGRQQSDSLGILLSQLATQSAALVRDEVALARQELREKVFSLRSVLLITGIGILLGFFALQTLYVAALIALAFQVGWWQAALLIAIGTGLLASLLIFLGIKRFNRMTIKPEQTLKTLEEDREWLKELT
jgi:uncharacterized membrane protein YqjE